MPPLDVDRFLEFVVTAHREAFNITFRSDITDEFLDKELARMRAAYTNDENSVVGAFVGSDISELMNRLFLSPCKDTFNTKSESSFSWFSVTVPLPPSISAATSCEGDDISLILLSKSNARIKSTF